MPTRHPPNSAGVVHISPSQSRGGGLPKQVANVTFAARDSTRGHGAIDAFARGSAVRRASPPYEAALASQDESLTLILDRVAQHAEPLDLDLADVTVLHPDRVRLARMADA